MTAWNWLPDGGLHALELIVPPGHAALVFLPVRTGARARAIVFDASRIEGCAARCPLAPGDVREVRVVAGADACGPFARELAGRYRVGRPVELGSGERTVFLLAAEGRLRMARSAEGPAAARAKTKVLVVDDSETIRALLTKIIAGDPALECVGAIGRPSLVDAEIARLRPDVLTLDIHMPEMNGVDLLKALLPKYGLPAVMISSLSREDGGLVLNALEAGAVDYIQKPSFSELALVAPQICEKIRSAALARVSKPAGAARARPKVRFPDTRALVLLGASTGGTEALREVLESFPRDIPPVAIVQHIPAVFSKAFADRLNALLPFEVKEAADGDRLVAGRVLIAPGGRQMSIAGNPAGELWVRVDDSAPVNRHRPSVDVLFESGARLKGIHLVGALLTGMGADGARGLLALKNAGARTLAQDEATCTVYGMPREAAKLGAAGKIVALPDIAGAIAAACLRSRAGAA